MKQSPFGTTISDESSIKKGKQGPGITMNYSKLDQTGESFEGPDANAALGQLMEPFEEELK